MKILIVEDNKLARLTLIGLLRGHEIVEATTFSEAEAKLKNEKFELALLDIDLDIKEAGLKLAKSCKKIGLYAIMTTGHIEDEIIEKAYQYGCQDYLVKPISKEALNLTLDRFNSFGSEKRINDLINKNYITNHAPTLKELDLVKRVSLSDKPILINGASGTGKSILAKLIKEACRIPDEQYVELNCAQFSDGLIESELFGHVKGSFTGATENKVGLLQKANNGLIFLDEIHSLSKSAQQKLMKAIEEKTFYPVGSNQIIKSNFRVVCATCDNLLELVEEKKFRPDFYARISHLQIQLYPLKERKEDIIPLIEYYNSKYLRKISIPDVVKKELQKLEWRNNARDIEALVDYWHINSLGVIKTSDIPESFYLQKLEFKKSLSKQEMKRITEVGLKDYISELKVQIIEQFLDKNENNKSETAKDLKVTDYYVSYALKRNQATDLMLDDEVLNENRIQ